MTSDLEIAHRKNPSSKKVRKSLFNPMITKMTVISPPKWPFYDQNDGYIDVDDRCRRRNVLATILRCW